MYSFQRSRKNDYDLSRSSRVFSAIRNLQPALKQQGLVRAVLVVFVIFFMPNALLYSVASYLGIGRPIINFDYIVVSVFFIVGFSWLGSLFLLLVYVCDAIFLVGQIFPFLRPSDLLYFSGLLVSAPVYYKLIFFLAVVQFFVFCYFFRFLKKNGQDVVFLNLALIFYVLNLLYFDDVGDKYYRYNNDRVVDSVFVFSFDNRKTGFVDSFSLESKPLVSSVYQGATSPWFSSPMKLSDKVVLIVSESWGVSSDEVMNAVIAPLYRVGGHVRSINRGEIEFSGATVDGELRELCQLSTVNFNLKDLEVGFEDCLPNRFKALGYDTYALHGAVGSMYDRVHWYPKAGFEQSVFYETKSWSEKCYSFPGACDRELVTELPKALAENEKVFFYWLTLNSHSIYDERDIYKDVFDCAEFFISESGQVCRNLKLQAQFFYYLSTVLSDPSFEGSDIIIVGDHVPPVFNKVEKEKHFKSKAVPWVRLKIASRD